MPANQLTTEETFSLKADLLAKWQVLAWAFQQWRIWIWGAVLGSIVSIGYYWFVPATYSARTSFVVEDSKAAGGSIMSALAGQFGFDISSISGASSTVLAGDNVQALLRSRSIIKKTLLTPIDSSSKTTLADWYASSYELKEKWLKSRQVGKQIDFTYGKSFTRQEDSLLQRIVKQIIEKELSVAKPDRKLGFFDMVVTMRNEDLAAIFSRRLLKAATDFYINTKTRRLVTNVQRLQGKADTLETMLNTKTYSAADAQRLLLDVNPAYASPAVSAEISARDKMMLGTIYAEIVKNLEISKTALIQETPTVQVVDEPELPLKKNQMHWLLLLAMGAAAGSILLILYISLCKKNTDK
jgi:hypothetical protein